MRVEELEGVRLNYWTAKAAGLPFKIDPVDDGPILETETGWVSYNPVVDWSQCGPLIELFEVKLGMVTDAGHWFASVFGVSGCQESINDPKAAICRAVVANVYGEKVPND